MLIKEGLVLFDRIFEVRLASSLGNEVGLACFDPGLIGSEIRFHGAEWIRGLGCQPSALRLWVWSQGLAGGVPAALGS